MIRRSRGRIALAGAVAQRPRRAGHAWVFLQYLLGFRRLGWDVLFIDRLPASRCGPERSGRALAASPEATWLRDVCSAFGLEDAYALLGADGEAIAGRARADVRSFLRDADLLLDFMGYLDDDELRSAARFRVFLDLDPGFDQMWDDLGLADPYEGYDAFVTVGLNVGDEACRIPTCGRDWLPTVQPVALEEWAAAGTPSGAFTSVATWRGDYGPLEHGGRTYGLRVHEFRRFLELPARTGERFELALDIHADETEDRRRLARHGWILHDPLEAAGDPFSYRDFIRGSLAELLVPKELYVGTRSGWFSDRSICYLASGRPVLARDTGLGDHLPHGEGLLLFEDLEGAVAGVEAIAADPRRHGRAARAIAEARFDSGRVLERLLDALSSAAAGSPDTGARGR